MTIDLSGRVVIITGAGGGLGRAHALALAARGARIVVNDLGNAEDTVNAITRAGGQAIASSANVTDFDQVKSMITSTIAQWGKVDILVNNAGIIRDRTFSKMDLDDFRLVIDVHLMGSVNCIKAVWDPMRSQGYGRIINTSSSSGLFGNFGQSNYGAAKLALVGLTNTLGLEGEKYNVRVNCLAPTASTQMTENVMSEEELEQLAPDKVSAGVVFLASEGAPNRAILLAGAGSFEASHIVMTKGVHIGTTSDAAERIALRWAEINDMAGAFVPGSGLEQGKHEIALLKQDSNK